MIEHKGKKLSYWSLRYGIKYQVLRDRLLKLGWSFDRAVRTPTQKRGAKPTLFYKGKSILQWAKEKGIKPATIHTRLLSLGWSWSDAVNTPAKGPGRRKGDKR